MAQIPKLLQETLRQHVKDAVKEALPALASIRDAGHYISHYYEWTQASFDSDGFPTFSKPPMSGPPDYTGAFGSGSPITTDDLPSFKALTSFLAEHEELCARVLPLEKATDPRIFFVMVSLVPLDLLDRFVHLNPSLEFSESAFASIYEPFHNACFLDSLVFDLHIPILFVGFSFDSYSLNANLSIERMDRQFQLGRAKVTLYGSGVHEAVLPGASHCLTTPA
jgi:hypothetical protein